MIMHDQRRLVMAHSTPRAPNFSLRLLFSLGHATPCHAMPGHAMPWHGTPERTERATSSSTGSRRTSFLACCVQVTSIGENRPREKRLTSTYPPTYPPTCMYSSSSSSNAEPFCETRVDKPTPNYAVSSTSLFAARRLVSQVSPYFRRVIRPG